jgi:hypothetical protein
MPVKSADITALRRPNRSEKNPKHIPPKIAPIIEIAVMVARAPGPNPRCRCKNVGYISCVPWETQAIAVINSVRYKNNFQ